MSSIYVNDILILTNDTNETDILQDTIYYYNMATWKDECKNM